MNYRSKLKYFLVRKLAISHAQAQDIITQGKVRIDNETVFDNVLLPAYAEVKLNDKIISSHHDLKYYLYHKPAGIECTLNPAIAESLYHCLPEDLKDCYPAGRLDKSSEGLLLLMNDGNLLNKIIAPHHNIEKEYEVWLEKETDIVFLEQLRAGVDLKTGKTRPATVIKTDHNMIRITLTEGKNRQIRRMVFALGNYVTRLRRIRIAHLTIGQLPCGAFRPLNKEEITLLRNL